jgi:hypothetical protein
MAGTWAHLLIPDLHPLLPPAAHFSIPSLNAIVARKKSDKNLSVLLVFKSERRRFIKTLYGVVSSSSSLFFLYFYSRLC